MARATKNPKVDAYLRKAKKWQPEIAKLRTILLGCGLTEEFKWGKPAYTHDGANVVIIAPFKETCALLLAKGALLKDSAGILIKPGEHSQSTRQIRFTSAREISKMEPVLKRYVREAIDVEKAGLEVEPKKTTQSDYPEELRKKLAAAPSLKKAFESLTPGRQRGYIIYFSAAKQSKTRESRIERCAPLILKGKGLYD